MYNRKNKGYNERKKRTEKEKVKRMIDRQIDR